MIAGAPGSVPGGAAPPVPYAGAGGPASRLVRTLDRLARRRATWVALLATALAVRLVVVALAPPRLMWSDGRYYESMGWSLASSGTYGMETLYPPAYPTLIGAVYAVFGRSLLAVRVVDALVSTGTVAGAGAAGIALLNPAAGLLAAGFAAIHPVFVVMPVTHYVENLLAFLSVLAFWSFARALRTPTAGRWLAAGLAFGVFMLCKPSVMAFLPGLAAAAVAALARRRVAWWALAPVFLLGLALALAPWTVRNHGVHGAWYVVATGGGPALWRGNNEEATGSTKRNPLPTPAMRESLALRRTVVDKDRFFYERATRWMRAEPDRAAQLYLVKLGNLWALWPDTQTDTPYRNLAANAAMAVCSLTLYAGALLALPRVPGWGLGWAPLAVLTFSLASALPLTVLRYRMTFEVLLIWLAAAGWLAWLDRRAAGRPPRG